MVVETLNDNDTSWITSTFLKDLLIENGLQNDREVSLTELKSAIGKGENYMSILYRISVEIFDSEKKVKELRKLIIKTMPAGEFLVKLITDCQLFGKELRMYQEIFPMMKKIWKDSFEDSWFENFVPKSYKTERPLTVILEDIEQQGFKMASRHSRLDLDHCKIFMKALAKFHAPSVILAKEHPELKNYFKEMMYTEEKMGEMEKFCKQTLCIVADKIEEWDGMKRFGDNIRRLSESAIDVMINITKLEEGKFFVLNHGDCWVNNMMFKYSDDNHPIDIKFIDFQLAKFASPIFDIIYFLSTSVKDDVFDQHFETLLQEYLSELIFRLQNMNCNTDGLTIEYLKQEYRHKILFSLMIATIILPVVLVDPSGAVDLSSMTEDDFNNPNATDILSAPYSGQRFKEAFIKFLLRFERNGWFDLLNSC